MLIAYKIVPCFNNGKKYKLNKQNNSKSFKKNNKNFGFKKKNNSDSKHA